MVLCGLVCCVIFGLVITFLVISLHGNLSCSKLFLLLGTPAMLGVPFVQGIFFSIVLFVSYICKVVVFIDFCRLVGRPIIAVFK